MVPSMDDTQEFYVRLPKKMAEQVQRKVRSGAYIDAGEMIQDGIQVLLDRDEALEQWLREEVVPSIEECKADPGSTIPADQIMDRIRAAAHAKDRLGS
jgi:Arc/MetJ-type ribon-helix-helix transcriptional regulator